MNVCKQLLVKRRNLINMQTNTIKHNLITLQEHRKGSLTHIEAKSKKFELKKFELKDSKDSLYQEICDIEKEISKSIERRMSLQNITSFTEPTYN